jgi:hypothetical protein
VFQSFSRGWGFLKQSVEMATKDRDLIKPSLMSVVASLVVAILFGAPLVAVAFVSGESVIGRVVLFVFGAVLIFAQYIVSYIFAGMTVYLIYGYLAEGDGRMDKAWAIVRRDLLDLASLAVASTVVRLIENALRGNRRRGNLLGGLLATILEAVWTTATYFVLPAMIIEDLNLGQALKRATYMIKNNLLLVAVSEIGVSGIVGLFSFLLVVIALGFGFGIVVVFGGLGGALGLGLGIGLAVLVAGTTIGLTIAASGYITTAYHTCLFLWARDVERAQSTQRDSRAVPAPAPLAAALGA